MLFPAHISPTIHEVHMRRLVILLTILLASLPQQSASGAGDEKPAAVPSSAPITGFSAAGAKAERELEQRLDAAVRPENLRDWMKKLSARPHHTGSQADRQNAEFIAAQFRSFGYETAIEEFYVLFPTPKSRLLEMTQPTPFTAALVEPVLAEDGTSGQQAEQLPTYNAYSIDGDVTGELVYVNYGVPKDYEELERRGIDVKGKIVISRYGGSWRGIKPKVAAEHGALGCIIYSDPRDDGYFEGDVYPQGAYRNEHGVQRGSVMDAPVHSGDPLTPFIGATKDAKRLSIKEADVLTKIPVLPVSYADAQPLLKALGGPVAPEDWRGSLPITYHIGPGKAVVHLQVAFNWDIVPIYDVIATMKGSERPDEWIIRGNHHDAWVNGADDPTSGMVATMEEARVIGELARRGWKPKRTIVYCAWDAEEQGLLGSTEWAEAHADALKQKAAVYINSDSNGRGYLYAAGSHSLERFVNEVARDVTDPETKIAVWDRAKAVRIVRGSPEEKKDARERPDLRIGALGSGSDYTPFLQHLGIAALNIGYGGEDGGGSYHSIYDSFDHYTRFGDPSFAYGAAMAKTGGRLVLRLANADILPFEFGGLAETVGKYVKEVSKLADDMRAETDELNALITDRSLEVSADPTETFVLPKPKEKVPFLNFAPLLNAAARLDASAKGYREAVARMTSGGSRGGERLQRSIDGVLMGVERAATVPAGLPGRPWFTHYLYAPGKYTGYGVKTLPAVREAIELRQWQEAEAQLEVTAQALQAVSGQIDKAAQVIRGGE
jgi:N-acetylated-alpha-linked acidic dipeptidase